MKRIILLSVMLVALFQCTAHAIMPIPVELTNTATNDFQWNVGTGSTFLGPANRGGWAQGFFLPESYKVRSMVGFIKGTGDIDYQGNFSTAFYRFELYRGVYVDNKGFVPTGKAISQIGPYDVVLDGNQNRYGEHNLDFDLESGHYFFAYQGGNPLGATVQADGFLLEGDKFGSVHTPEPGTMFLLGGGALAALRLRRKRKI